MKIRTTDKNNYPELTKWLESDFLDVMGRQDIWAKFKLHAHITEFSARDAISGGIRSPRLIIRSLGDINGQFHRNWPGDIDLAKEIADRFEVDQSRQVIQNLVTSTLLALLVAWRRSKEDGGGVEQAKEDFLKSAYEPIPSRYWEKNIHPLSTGRERIIDLTETDISDLIRITIAEAGGEGKQGQAGVIFVVINRLAASPIFPGTVREVINEKNQFEPIKRHGGSVTLLPQPSLQSITDINRIIEEIAAGRLRDVTNGATFFLNERIANLRGTNFGSPIGLVAAINNHSFYDRFKNRAKVIVPPWIITTPATR